MVPHLDLVPLIPNTCYPLIHCGYLCPLFQHLEEGGGQGDTDEGGNTLAQSRATSGLKESGQERVEDIKDYKRS